MNSLSRLVTLAALVLTTDATVDPLKDHKWRHTVNPDRLKYKSGKKQTIHFVPHSHDDVGWRKTLDQYFDGVDKWKQGTNVKVELSSVISALLVNPKRTFSEVEMKFFSLWWEEQTPEMQETVRGLVKNGQLELINGGWSLHDEACPTYDDMIDNMMLGHKFIEENFGVKPRIGWQIDPFGHSQTNARLFAEMGFDAWFFARMDGTEKQQRMDSGELEWVWFPHKDALGRDTAIFTHQLYWHYSPPPGMAYDEFQDDTFFTDKASDVYNAPENAKKIMDHLEERAQHYLSDDILVLLGDDFTYQNAVHNYRFIDNTIEYLSQNYGDKFIFKYSTPGIYVDAVKKAKVAWPTRYDDMFPYVSDPDHAWTGYFTSRANNKDYTRRTSRLLHASSQIYASKVLEQKAPESELQHVAEAHYALLDAMGINQHHDAISGTGDQLVADDYSRRLSVASEINSKLLNPVVGAKVLHFSGMQPKESVHAWKQCAATNTTYLDCPTADIKVNEPMGVAVYNPSTLDLSEASFHVPPGKYEATVFDEETGDFGAAQNVSLSCSADYRYTATETQKVQRCIAHVVTKVPSKGYSLIQVKKIAEELGKESSINAIKAGVSQISRNDLSLKFISAVNGSSELTFELTDNETGEHHVFDFSLKQWLPNFRANENNPNNNNSGIYCFRPRDNMKDSLQYSKVRLSESTVSADQMDFFFGVDVENRWQASAPADETQFMRAIVHVSIDTDLKAVKFDVDLGSLPKPMHSAGSEVTVNFHLRDFTNAGTFWTDSNGLEMQKRILNYRPSFKLEPFYLEHNITTNYYPINTAISMDDVRTGRHFTVMNDKPQGGSSLKDGTVELMQNRVLVADDGCGQDDHLMERDETGHQIRVRATYYVQITSKTQKSVQRLVQHKVADPAQYFFAFDLERVKQPWRSSPSRLGQYLKKAGIDGTVRMLAIPRGKNSFDVRLENLADNYDSQVKDAILSVDLQAIVDAMWYDANWKKKYSSVAIAELSLTGNMKYAEMAKRKIHWKTRDDEKLGRVEPSGVIDGLDADGKVLLGPQAIRVFNVQYSVDQNKVFLQ